MVIIIMKRKLLRAVIALVFIILLGFCFYRCTTNTASAFWSSANVQNNIEIFDISIGNVTKIVPVNDTALYETKKILKGITGLYLKVNALPEKGYIIKIPFEPNIKVKNKWFIDYDINPIDKVFVIFPEDGTPYLLVLDKKERPYLFNFKGDTDILLKELDFRNLEKIS